MKIVVDANVVIAALAKQSITKEVLLYPFIVYYTPDFLFEELAEHEDEIIAKMHTSKAGYKNALDTLTKKLKVVDHDSYSHYLDQAKEIISGIDKDDVPYIATALSVKANGIWSYDSDFKHQKAVKLFSTSELLGMIKKGV